MSIVSGLIDRLLAASELITLLISFGLALWLAERRALRLGLDPALISQMGFGLGLGALAGGRLAYILADWRTYARYPFDILLVQGGLSLWGAILGGGLVLAWYARRRGLTPGALADGFAFPLAVGSVAYSLLCIVRGDCAGAVGAPPLAMVLPGYSLPRYPVELYVAALTAALAALLAYREPRRRFSGEVALLFLSGYAVLRFTTDFLRIHFGAWPTPEQAAAAVVAVGAGIVWLVLGVRARAATERGQSP